MGICTLYEGSGTITKTKETITTTKSTFVHNGDSPIIASSAAKYINSVAKNVFSSLKDKGQAMKLITNNPSVAKVFKEAGINIQSTEKGMEGMPDGYYGIKLIPGTIKKETKTETRTTYDVQTN